tara:strand:+ start:984 stop:1991 length:1008 start_codon:yes stop_codon:yes gene_type:complete
MRLVNGVNKILEYLHSKYEILNSNQYDLSRRVRGVTALGLVAAGIAISSRAQSNQNTIETILEPTTYVSSLPGLDYEDELQGIDLSQYGIENVLRVNGDVLYKNLIGSKVVVIQGEDHYSIEGRVAAYLDLERHFQENGLRLIGVEGWIDGKEFTTKLPFSDEQVSFLQGAYNAMTDPTTSEAERGEIADKYITQLKEILERGERPIVLYEGLHGSDVDTMGIDDSKLRAEHQSLYDEADRLIEERDKNGDKDGAIENRLWEIVLEARSFGYERSVKMAEIIESLLTNSEQNMIEIRVGAAHGKHLKDLLVEKGFGVVFYIPSGMGVNEPDLEVF